MLSLDEIISTNSRTVGKSRNNNNRRRRHRDTHTPYSDNTRDTRRQSIKRREEPNSQRNPLDRLEETSGYVDESSSGFVVKLSNLPVSVRIK